jgi:16S rRNA (cytosine967-C5)-methyltransferase
LKGDRTELARRLADEGIAVQPVPEAEDGLVLEERKNVFATKSFKDGLFEVQDGGSQQVVPLLSPQPGERVIDACAGAGGKTLHIAARMKNRGKVLALDVHARKLEDLRLRSRRAGADIVEVREISSTKVIKRLLESADRVLLDVPCSGSGVWRRNPDGRWKLTPEEITRLRELQGQILRDYSRMVKPGGILVYATCSLWPSENQNQVKRFLTESPGRFELEQELTTAPHRTRFDGFYAARLRKSPS